MSYGLLTPIAVAVPVILMLRAAAQRAVYLLEDLAGLYSHAGQDTDHDNCDQDQNQRVLHQPLPARGVAAQASDRPRRSWGGAPE